jgi:DNA polymerase-3 subunit delta
VNKKKFEQLDKLPNFLVFYGNRFFLENYQKKIEEKFKNENLLKLYYDEFDKTKAKFHLIESSLFGGRNVLIVKTNKFNKELEELKKYAKDNYCFVFYTGNKKLELKKNEFVRFFDPSFKEIVEYINEICKQEDIVLTNEAKNFLAKSIEPSFLENEIKKLANYKKEISLKDVEELVFLYKEESFEELFVKILQGKDFFEDLKNILQISDFKIIIRFLIGYLTNLYQYYLYIKITGKSTLKDFLGYQLPFDIERQRVELSMSLKEKDYKHLFDYLLNKELLIRNSEKEKEAIFWEVMFYLKNFRSF